MTLTHQNLIDLFNGQKCRAGEAIKSAAADAETYDLRELYEEINEDLACDIQRACKRMATLGRMAAKFQAEAEADASFFEYATMTKQAIDRIIRDEDENPCVG